MSGMMLHGLGDCTPELHCGCLSSPPLREEVQALRDAIKRVKAVHTPIPALHTNTGTVREVCTGCGTDNGNWQTWPCPTIKALREATP